MDAVEKILDQVDREVGQAIRDPEAFDFRQKDAYKVPLEPENSELHEAVVDLENQNVEVRYMFQSQRENYVCVKHIPDEDTGENEIALVESNQIQDINGRRMSSTIHYLVDGDEIYKFQDGSYEETLQTRPIDAANQFTDLYTQALEKDNKKQASRRKGTSKKIKKPVPPPEDDEMFR